MPYALCPMPYARLSSVDLMLRRKAIFRPLPTKPSTLIVGRAGDDDCIFEQFLGQLSREERCNPRH